LCHCTTSNPLNRADKTDDIQVAVSLELLVVNVVVAVQLGDEAGPLGTEHVGTRERTITTANGETVDTKGDEVARGAETTLASADCR
jgi:hypothetical protein